MYTSIHKKQTSLRLLLLFYAELREFSFYYLS